MGSKLRLVSRSDSLSGWAEGFNPGVDQKLPGIDDVVTKLRRRYRGNSLRYDLFVSQIAVVRDHDDHVGRIVAADIWSTISNLYAFVG